MAQHAMQWERLLTPSRCGEKSRTRDDRSEFQRDIGRITFSDPFRRLARKSQVHPLNENDHIHSRLTHSLEVANVGASLGEAVGRWLLEQGELPQGEHPVHPMHLGQIVQAACLAHDIGNPPFGHSGEGAIKSWFKDHAAKIQHLDAGCKTDFTKFDGNAMAVRVLLSTGFYTTGMSPTLPVLGALMKYPWPSGYDAGKDKFSYFQTEAALVEEAARAMGMPDLGGRFARHPLAFLAEAADDICYRLIDLEDATEVGILEPEFMFREFAEHLEIDKEGDRDRYERYAGMHYRQLNSILRTKMITLAVEECVAAFAGHYGAIMNGTFDDRKSLMETQEGGACELIRRVYKSIEGRLFLSRRKVELELGAQRSIGMLLDVLMEEVGKLCTGDESPNKGKVEILLGSERIRRIQEDRGTCPYRVVMAALDYVTGMSDHYATESCRKLMGLGF